MELLQQYESMKSKLKKSLEQFKKVAEGSDDLLFSELCFCLCTPQSKARVSDAAIKSLVSSGDFFSASEKKVAVHLLKAGVRFHHTKAKRIVEAREWFFGSDFRKHLDFSNLELREFLVENVKGFGWKEASHFLRNIGKGEGLTILDRHILRNLVNYKVIKTIPKSMTKKNYMMIEKKMIKFAKKLQIPVEELDILFWAKETGEVFK